MRRVWLSKSEFIHSLEEKERRIAQHKKYEARRKETIEKIAARTFARFYVEPLVPSVYEQLYMNGYFSDTLQNEITETVIPELLDAVCEELDFDRNCRALLDSMIREAAIEVNEIYARLDADNPEEVSEAVEEIQQIGDNKAEQPSEDEEMLKSESERRGSEASGDHEPSQDEDQPTDEVDHEGTNDEYITENDDEIEN
ncbi:hypothetical protein Aperf_G00000112022 [Anoplocephala perfoliata]